VNVTGVIECKDGIKASMSRKGNCRDNACSESLFGSLKVEQLHGMEFRSQREAEDARSNGWSGTADRGWT
jgi:transposase InsO family protein